MTDLLKELLSNLGPLASSIILFFALVIGGQFIWITTLMKDAGEMRKDFTDLQKKFSEANLNTMEGVQDMMAAWNEFTAKYILKD